MKRSLGSSTNKNGQQDSSAGKSEVVEKTHSQLASDWCTKRDVYPFQGEVALDFNYWISHNSVDSNILAEMVASKLSGEKVSVLGPAGAARHVVVVAVSNVNHAELKANLSQCNFLQCSTSMPALLVQKSCLPSEQAYEWFYNDVKSVNSLLLWPAIPRTAMPSVAADLSVKTLLEGFVMTLRGASDYITLVPDHSTAEAVQLIVDTARLTLETSSVPVDERYRLLMEMDASTASVGRIFQHRSGEEGFFALMSADAGARLLLIWERGDLYSLDQVSADDSAGQHAFRSLACHSNAAGEVVESTPVLYAIHSIVPLPRIQRSVEAKDPPPPPALPGGISERFASLPAGALESLVLSTDMLVALGYLQEVELTLCLSTASASWPLGALEDGEEDSDLTALHAKLQSQAKVHKTVSSVLDIAAVDCEMCTTKIGLELTRVTVLHPLHGIVLDTLVRPSRDILDYHTEFSGVTAESLEMISVTLADVQTALRLLIGPRTILIGHSLDSDLRALQIIHTRVIDTAAIYVHGAGLPYKHALKRLAKEVLGKDIQDSDKGHDSAEDALAALDLALIKASGSCGSAGDAFFSSDKSYYQQPKYTLFEHCLRAAGLDGDKMRISVHSSPALGSRPSWEADALGYREDSYARIALSKFLDKLQGQPSLSGSLAGHDHRHHSSWQDMLAAVEADLQANGHAESRRMIWCDLSLLGWSSITPEEVEDELPRKRLKVDAQSSTSVPAPSGPSVVQLDAALQKVYAALPADTAMVVVTQADLQAVRQQVSKKIRNKWIVVKKGQKIPLPMQRFKEEAKLSNEWNSAEDEQVLLTAAHLAAKGCVFLRHKKM